MGSKYVDTTSIMQVIGCVFNKPQILEVTDKYSIVDEDFSDPFHKTIFGAIYKIYELGANKITLESLSDFFASRPKSEAIYKQGKGEEWLLKVSESCMPSAFDYYYGRLKKFSLLRAFDNCGIDVSDIYDPDNIMDVKKKQLQEDRLDNSTLEEIADIVDTTDSGNNPDIISDADISVFSDICFNLQGCLRSQFLIIRLIFI